MPNQAQVVERNQTGHAKDAFSDLTVPQQFGHHGRAEHGIPEPNNGEAVGSEPPSEMPTRLVKAVSRALQKIDQWLTKTQ